MNGRRATIVAVTFISGLYFVLDFVMPPTLPGATREGVVARHTWATISVQSAGLTPTPYVIHDSGLGRPEVLSIGRDITGQLKQSPVLLRQVGIGSQVSMRLGPYTANNMSGAVLNTSDGKRIVIAPSQQLFSQDGKALSAQSIAAGTVVTLEQRNARIVAIDRGSILLIDDGRRVNHPLGATTALLRVSRNNPPTEVSLDDLRTGDTVRIGPQTTFADNRDAAAQFNTVITTMAFGMGLLSLAIVHGKTLRRLQPGWYLSAAFFAAVAVGVMAGVYKSADAGTPQRAFSDLIVLRLLAAVTSTIFSLLAFYMASAAYRAFRIRTAEAAVMMISALIVMLGQTPFGTYLTSWMGDRLQWLWLPNVAAWVLRVPNTAVFRGLIFGIMLGAIGTALRYWLSLERSAAMGD